MSLPYFPMFPSDFEAKTSHLTMAEDGAYNRLLRICWMTPGCSMPDDEAWIMRRARAFTEADKEAVRSVLAEFFKAENGRLSNARLTKEWLAANEAHDKRKTAGAKGGKAKALKSNENTLSNAKAMLKQPEPEPEVKRETGKPVSCATADHDIPEPDQFIAFWDQYPHRNGARKGKEAARKAWAKAIKARASPAEIIAGAMRYAGDRQVQQGFAKDPSTWLNQKGWEDEIEQSGFGDSAHGYAGNRSGAGGSGLGLAGAFALVGAQRLAASGRH